MIPPGGEGEVKAVLSTKGRSGPIQKKISVNSDDPDTPRLTLFLKGEVVVDVSFTPRFLSFGRVGKKEKASREFSLNVNEPDKVKVTSVAIDHKDFSIKRISGDPNGKATYNVAFKGGIEIGQISAKVQVALTGSDMPTAELPIRIAIMSDLEYRKAISFRKSDDVFKPQIITFKSRSGKQVAIKGVEDPGRLLNVTVVTAKGAEASISAEVDETKVKDERSSGHKLFVKTNNPDEPVAEIMYSISQSNARRTTRPRRGFAKDAIKLKRGLVNPQKIGPGKATTPTKEEGNR